MAFHPMKLTKTVDTKKSVKTTSETQCFSLTTQIFRKTYSHLTTLEIQK